MIEKHFPFLTIYTLEKYNNIISNIFIPNQI